MGKASNPGRLMPIDCKTSDCFVQRLDEGRTWVRQATPAGSCQLIARRLIVSFCNVRPLHLGLDEKYPARLWGLRFIIPANWAEILSNRHFNTRYPMIITPIKAISKASKGRKRPFFDQLAHHSLPVSGQHC